MSRIVCAVFAGLMVSIGASVNGEESKFGAVEPVLEGLTTGRTCWYAGEQYSEGAPLEVGGKVLFCLPKHRHETNGELIWRPAPREDRKPKIQVN